MADKEKKKTATEEKPVTKTSTGKTRPRPRRRVARRAETPPTRRLSVLFVTPECAPFATSGGLGEVAGSLPAALNRSRKTRMDCRVILPLYGKISDEFREKMKFLGEGRVPVAWKNQYIGLFELKKDGTVYYFIDNEYYFKRDGLYGYYDDCERFAYFSRAVFTAMEIADFHPNIIHANDWQSALVPIYQNSLVRKAFTRTVFTIHNIEYQGHYGKDVLESCLGLPEDQEYIVDFRGDVNLMKGAIESCNVLSTVSPTYAQELKDPVFSFGLDEIIRRNEHKLTGILNGIDVRTYDPARDPLIAANYSEKDLSGKAACKRALQEELRLPTRDVPMITLISRLVPAKGMDLIMHTLDGVLRNNDVQFVMLGTGNGEYENYFRSLQYNYPDKVCSMIEFDTAKSHRVYAAGDILLMPSRCEPCGLSQMIGCRYGDIPVVRETGGLKDSIKDCTLGDGNGFTFADYGAESFYHAVMNAVSRCGDKDKWEPLVRHDLSMDFSWRKAAGQYIQMYESMMEQ